MPRTIVFLSVLVLAVGANLPARSYAQTDQSAGAVFLMTNAADKNVVIAYQRATDGSLHEQGRFATGGRGSGGVTDPLGSQGSLTLTQDHSFLLAVNAGSGDISSFRVKGAALTLVDRVACRGSEPVAIAQYRDLVYVLDAGGTSNVNGFRLSGSGELEAIPNSIAFLTTANSGPGSLAFSPDGQFLLVTEKITNNIDIYPVKADGTLGTAVITPGAGPGVFAISFSPTGIALLSETGPAGTTDISSITSYVILPGGTLSAVSTNVPTQGSATCWQAVTPDGRFVYTSNSASSTISAFSLVTSGTLAPLAGTVVGTLPTGSTNLDIAISSDGKFLYTLDSGTGTVHIFGVRQDGTLNNLGDIGGLGASVGLNGIAAI